MSWEEGVRGEEDHQAAPGGQFQTVSLSVLPGMAHNEEEEEGLVGLMTDMRTPTFEELTKAKIVRRERVLIEPSEEEARNGWTAESLTTYIDERRGAQEANVDPHLRPRVRPSEQNHRYDPHKPRRNR